MFARAAIDSGSAREVIVAPESAVYEVDGKDVVFVPAGDGKFSVRPVTLGRRGNVDRRNYRGTQTRRSSSGQRRTCLESLIVNKAAD